MSRYFALILTLYIFTIISIQGKRFSEVPKSNTIHFHASVSHRTQFPNHCLIRRSTILLVLQRLHLEYGLILPELFARLGAKLNRNINLHFSNIYERRTLGKIDQFWYQ